MTIRYTLKLEPRCVRCRRESRGYYGILRAPRAGLEAELEARGGLSHCGQARNKGRTATFNVPPYSAVRPMRSFLQVTLQVMPPDALACTAVGPPKPATGKFS